VSWEAVVQAIRARPGEVLPLAVERGGTRLGIEVAAGRATENGGAHRPHRRRAAHTRRGRRPHRGACQLRSARERRQGAAKTWDISIFSLKMLGKMLVGEVSWKHLSGPVTIADYAGQSAQMGWLRLRHVPRAHQHQPRRAESAADSAARTAVT
jgi:regulator of sigma E protease